ncbi:MAG TPA: glycosyl hydrolase family 28 protein [Saprospiraceae bacterium]|nr:glycosyl hydrolase family 28 protein [Saprospiraceae bacterium]
MEKYSVLNFGGIGNGKQDESTAIQKAIDACCRNGGGTVFIPAGLTLLTGPFCLKSNVTLHVERGARLIANPDESVYTQSAFRENKGEGSIWISGEHVENVGITGGGIIDGNGIAFMGAERKDSYLLKPFDVIDPRPHLLTLIDVKNISIYNITFTNAAYWGLHFIGCENVLIRDVFIFNSLKIRNGDGIDIDHSQNVNISNCHIESGDDCICFKNRREYAEYGPCSDITVTGCTLTSTSCAIKFGSENMDEIKNVVINNCIIKNSNRGIGIQNRDEGTISNILISNIILDCRLFSDVWWGKAEPIYVTAFPRAKKDGKDGGIRFPPNATKGHVGKVSNIFFSNIRCTSENGIFVAAENASKVDNIQFKDISIHLNKVTPYKGGSYDCRPCEGTDMIFDDTAGFYLMNVANISIKNCQLTWGENRPPYYKKGLKLVNCQAIDILNYAYPTDKHKVELNTQSNKINS